MKRPDTVKIKNGLRKRLMALIQNTVQSGKIPPEQKLSEMLGVNRFLLRQVIDDLVIEGILYRVAHHGTYLRQYALKTVGIVQDFGKTDGYCNFPLIFAGICETLEENNFIIRFLNPRDEEELAALINRYALSACIIANVDKPDARKILSFMPEATRRKVVLVSACPYNLGESIQWNYVENCPSGAARVDSIVNAGGKRIAILTRRSRSLDDMLSRIQELQLEWHNSWLMENEGQAKLPRLIQRGKIDSILVDGSEEMYDALISILAQTKKFCPVISIAYDKRFKLLLEKYPGIKANFLYFYYSGKNLGTEAGEMAVRISRTDEYQQPVFVDRIFINKKQQRRIQNEKLRQIQGHQH